MRSFNILINNFNIVTLNFGIAITESRFFCTELWRYFIHHAAILLVVAQKNSKSIVKLLCK